MNKRHILSLSAIAAMGVALLPGSAPAQQRALKEKIVGTWMKVSNDNFAADGAKRQLFGPNPKGITVYDAGGRYTQIMLRSVLPNFKANNRMRGTAEEYAVIVRGSAASFGTWSIDEASTTLIISPEGGFFPNLVGRESKRSITLMGDELRVSNPSASSSQFALTPPFRVLASADDDAGYIAYVHGNFADALHHWRPLAEIGDKHAEHGLGILYLNGEGVPRNHATALKWFGKAATQGLADSQLKLGVMHALGAGVQKNDTIAFDWFLKAAVQGQAQAQLHLGEAYYLGVGTPKNFPKAVKWFRMAATQGNVIGQNILGALYEDGIAVGQDYAEAVRWYKEAAERGHGPAQENLADAYYYGRGLPRDYVQAYMWYDLAVMHGQKRAAKERELVASKMQSFQIARAQKLSRDWQPRIEKH